MLFVKTNIIDGEEFLTDKHDKPVKYPVKIVLVGGCFDILHHGHITFLAKAKAQGDYLIVALENDSFITSNKNRRPFHNQTQRAEVLASLRSIDLVIKLPTMKSDLDYELLVQKVHPSIIAVTAKDPKIIQKKKYAKIVGAKVVNVSKLITGLSSSTIRDYASILHD